MEPSEAKGSKIDFENQSPKGDWIMDFRGKKHGNAVQFKGTSPKSSFPEAVRTKSAAWRNFRNTLQRGDPSQPKALPHMP